MRKRKNSIVYKLRRLVSFSSLLNIFTLLLIVLGTHGLYVYFCRTEIIWGQYDLSKLYCEIGIPTFL